MEYSNEAEIASFWLTQNMQYLRFGSSERHHIPTHTLSSPITTTTVSKKFPKVSRKFSKKIIALLPLTHLLRTGNFSYSWKLWGLLPLTHLLRTGNFSYSWKFWGLLPLTHLLRIGLRLIKLRFEWVNSNILRKTNYIPQWFWAVIQRKKKVTAYDLHPVFIPYLVSQNS
jgi:hypothetical protein